ncbi:MAG: hypothetical protein KKD64_13480 [Alphaproteobacteria bacterium]|nr:hypothetical protein [Alphaproteobacteria bacterium]MBU0792515.1 hypothetical protein [Alphaproteobacteria bacterium]MBU0877359.1 hypothetical protein [Alphaproteobacteria bacterium]MBU1770646.1 hypothetical protein [Alphaproteobacteria bacterium]
MTAIDPSLVYIIMKLLTLSSLTTDPRTHAQVGLRVTGGRGINNAWTLIRV